MQEIQINEEKSEKELEQMFKDPNKKKLIKNHPIPLIFPDMSKITEDMVSSDSFKAAETGLEKSFSSYKQEQQQAQTQEDVGWGGWFTSNFANVVNTVQHSANALGTKIQHFVEEEFADDSSTTSSSEQQGETSEQQQQNAEESIFLDVIETAEKGFYSFVGWGKSTIEKVSETEEIKNLKKAAENLTMTTKNATLTLYEQIASNLGLNLRGNRDALLRIKFEDLFAELGGNKFYEELNSNSLKSQMRQEAVLSKMNDTDRKNALIILKMIETILNADECYSKTVPENNDIKLTRNGKEILELIEQATKTCNKVVESFREVTSSENNNSSEEHLLQIIETGCIVLEKLRTEFLRALALIATKNFERTFELSHSIYNCKNLDSEFTIPEHWITADQLKKDKNLPKYELLAHIMRNYCQFTTGNMVDVARIYMQTAQTVQAIVNSEIKKFNDDHQHEEHLSEKMSHTSDRLNQLVNTVLEKDSKYYTSKENNVVRDSIIFFSHILKSVTASTLKNDITKSKDASTSNSPINTEETKDANEQA